MNETVKIKMKPTFNFQSIEVELEIDPKKQTDIHDAMKLYDKLLTELMIIAPEQDNARPRTAAVPPQPRVKLASERQKQIMDRFGLYYDQNTTEEEASALIRNSMNASRG